MADTTASTVSNMADKAGESLSMAMKWWETHQTFLIDMGIRVAVSILILIAGFMVAKFVRYILIKIMDNRKIDPTISHFVGELAKFVALAAFFIAAMDHLGIQTTSLVAIIGAASLAVGMALQGSLSNFSSGVILIFFRPIKVGEYIIAGGAEGTVQEVSIFNTTLLTVDNKQVIVPNGAILSGNIVNVSRMPDRRVDMNINVAYDSDIAKVKEILEKVAAGMDIVDQSKAPSVTVEALTNHAVRMSIKVWTSNANYFTVIAVYLESAKKALQDAGITIPVFYER